MREELEGEGRGDYVGDVCDADVKVGEVDLHDVAVDDLEVARVRRALHAALQLEDHAGGELHGHHVVHACTRFARSSSFIVRLPVPGPISSTTSVLFSPDFSTMDCTTSGFFRMCCPLDLWNSMPAQGTEGVRAREEQSARQRGGRHACVRKAQRCRGLGPHRAGVQVWAACNMKRQRYAPPSGCQT